MLEAAVSGVGEGVDVGAAEGELGDEVAELAFEVDTRDTDVHAACQVCAPISTATRAGCRQVGPGTSICSGLKGSSPVMATLALAKSTTGELSVRFRAFHMYAAQAHLSLGGRTEEGGWKPYHQGNCRRRECGAWRSRTQTRRRRSLLPLPKPKARGTAQSLRPSSLPDSEKGCFGCSF